MNWTKVGIDRDTETQPDSHELVWIYTMDDEVELGYWDWGWWCLWNGSDDVHVTAWAPLDYPSPPGFAIEWHEEIVRSWEES